jgi:hypothetical protein
VIRASHGEVEADTNAADLNDAATGDGSGAYFGPDHAVLLAGGSVARDADRHGCGHRSAGWDVGRTWAHGCPGGQVVGGVSCGAQE